MELCWEHTEQFSIFNGFLICIAILLNFNAAVFEISI